MRAEYVPLFLFLLKLILVELKYYFEYFKKIKRLEKFCNEIKKEPARFVYILYTFFKFAVSIDVYIIHELNCTI
jgi:hypothetical protein